MPVGEAEAEGWVVDPMSRGEHRYHRNGYWTAFIRTNGVVSEDHGFLPSVPAPSAGLADDPTPYATPNYAAPPPRVAGLVDDVEYPNPYGVPYGARPIGGARPTGGAGPIGDELPSEAMATEPTGGRLTGGRPTGVLGRLRRRHPSS